MKILSQKNHILIFAAFLVAVILAGAVFWRSSKKEFVEKKEQVDGSQNIQAQNSEMSLFSVNQTGQANQAGQILSIEKSAEEGLGGDFEAKGASFVAEPKEENGVKVEVGDPSGQEFLPEVTLSRWDETKMTLKPKALDGIAAEDKTVSFEKDKIKFDTPKIGYSLENLPVSEDRPEGGFEYNIVLKEKPKTNVVSLNIETENLDFFYQPALNTESLPPNGVSATETDIFDKDGKSITHRPENVVGSYAVYYKDGKSGDFSALGGKNYKAGKAFHIFRPRIDDVAGKWTWGDLHIDERKGLLTVTIPQDFLDKAVYPVKHAAGLEFGYHTNGFSGQTYAAAWIEGTNGTPASSGSVSKISAYTSKATNLKGVLVLASNKNIVANGVSNPTATGADLAWNDLYYSNQPSVSNVAYYACFINQASVTVMYDSGKPSGTYWFEDTTNNYTTPTNPTDASTYNTYVVSIYATYTAAASVNLKQNVNFGNNVNFK